MGFSEYGALHGNSKNDILSQGEELWVAVVLFCFALGFFTCLVAVLASFG